MKIGIIGSGVVAQSLASGLLRHGHSVQLGTSAPERLAGWLADHPGASAASMAAAAAFGEIVILAVKGSAAVAAAQAGGAALDGKVVIDACNPIADVAPTHGVLSFFTGGDDSLMERLQAALPAARFVKAFSSVGNALFIDPKMAGGARPTMFICGNDEAAKAVVVALLGEVGWDAADMGRVEAARAIEPLCRLWCIPGMLRGEWTHAFALLQQGV